VSGGVTRIELLRDVAKNGARKIKLDGRPGLVYLDSFTASAMLAVHNALNEGNRATFLALPWRKAVAVTWKLVK
jgi:hypothetical protein